MNSTSIDLTKSKTNWSLSFKIKRGVWTYLLEPLVRWWPKSFSPLRIAALRLMGANIGKRCLILPGGTVLMPWNLTLKDYVAISAHVNIYNFAPVEIGTMTVVSQNCHLCTGSHDYRQGHMPLVYYPIRIGSECWVASGAYIGPGVEIPDGAVVGAMSVVVKTLPSAWSVYAGNPCVFIKPRVMAEHGSKHA